MTTLISSPKTSKISKKNSDNTSPKKIKNTTNDQLLFIIYKNTKFILKNCAQRKLAVFKLARNRGGKPCPSRAFSDDWCPIWCPRPVTIISPKFPTPKGYSFFYIKVFFIILKFLSLDLVMWDPMDWFLFSAVLVTGTKPLISILFILSLILPISS